MIEIIEKEEELKEFLATLSTRGDITDSPFQATVEKIVKDVKLNKDEALFNYIKQFENKNITKESFIIDRTAMKKGYDNLTKELKEVLNTAYARIYKYHEYERRNSFSFKGDLGETMGQRITPLENVAIYVPGGKAAYPSSIIMNAVPAIIAGVKNLYMATPAKEGGLSDTILAAAYICNVKEIYSMGGSQAIAALAYGTESVTRVDKIVGPGNIFVTLAKKMVFGTVGIDSIAGPSEITILADEFANSKYAAADLLSQAEHDELASAILITNSKEKALEIQDYVTKFVSEKLSRKNILLASIKKYCRIIIVKDMLEACELASRIAPEHLELLIKDASNYVDKIRNAGCIFIGSYSPEPLGDYMAGSNHVLPTCGTARFFSPLGVDDFIKKTSLVNFPQDAFYSLGEMVKTFALEEGLDAHANSVEVRLNDR